MIKSILAGILVSLLSTACYAQGVNQGGGAVKSGHAAKWSGDRTIMDAGGAEGGNPNVGLTELSIVGSGEPFCIYDSPTTNQFGYHKMCFGASSTSSGSAAATITIGSGGGAANLPLKVCFQGGVCYQVPSPVGGGSLVNPVGVLVGHGDTVSGVPLGTAGMILQSGGTGTDPLFGYLDLSGGSVTGKLPAANLPQDGTFRNLTVSAGTFDSVYSRNNVQAVGNVIGATVQATGSLSGATVQSTGAMTAASLIVSGAFSAGTVFATGNIQSLGNASVVNLTVNGNETVSGTLSAGGAFTAGSVFTSGGIQGGAISGSALTISGPLQANAITSSTNIDAPAGKLTVKCVVYNGGTLGTC